MYTLIIDYLLGWIMTGGGVSSIYRCGGGPIKKRMMQM